MASTTEQQFPASFVPNQSHAPADQSPAKPAPSAAPAPPAATPTTKTALKVKKTIGKNAKSRAGVPNYTDADICALLDCVQEVEPLGANHWAMVAHKFGEWARANEKPEREQDSLKNKFDKMANAKKKTGDPSCAPNIRRAKLIARDIHAKCAAMTLDDDSSIDEETKGDTTESTEEETATEKSFVGEYKDKRKTAATGTVSKGKVKSEDVLLGHIGDMAEHMGNMCNLMTSSNNGITREEVTKIVKEEVAENLRPTNNLLYKMHSMLKSISSQGQNGP